VVVVVVVAVQPSVSSPPEPSISRGDGGSLGGGDATGVAGAETVRSRRESEPSLLPLSFAESALSISISGSLECDLVRAILLGRSRVPSLLEVAVAAACSGGRRGEERELGERVREMFGMLTTCGEVGAEIEEPSRGVVPM